MIRVLIVDDQTLFAEALEVLINSIKGLKVIGLAFDGADAIEQLKTKTIDVVLMDIRMPEGMSGIEATQHITNKFPLVKVIMVSVDKKRDSIQQSLAAGAKGYLLKTVKKTELTLAIQMVNSGSTYYVDEVSKAAIDAFVSPNTVTDTRLTNREKETLKLICAGHSTNDIAHLLKISPSTVDTF